jgi:hypothetical protein
MNYIFQFPEKVKKESVIANSFNFTFLEKTRQTG